MAKYAIGDKFRENNRIRGYTWLEVSEILYGVVEPIYTLEIKPLNGGSMLVGEADLDENFRKINR